MRKLRDRWILIWSSLCGLLVMVVTALVIALLAVAHANLADSGAKHVAACVNTVLGTRSAPATKDSLAHIDFAEALDALFLLPPNPTPAQSAEALRTFRAAVDKYVTVLVADQKARDDNPLGRC